MAVANCHSCQFFIVVGVRVINGENNIRENEAISVQPLGVLGVELHEFVEQDVGNRCHAPRNESANNSVSSVSPSFHGEVSTHMGAPGCPELLLKVASTWRGQHC